MAETVDISAKLEALFPLGQRPFMLELAPAQSGRQIPASEPRAVVVMRTILWEATPEGEWQLRDIKEQELDMGWPALYDDGERVAAFFAALHAVMADLDPAKLETLMPTDLVHVDALKLRRARTQADFEAALRAKRRLGAWLVTEAPP